MNIDPKCVKEIFLEAAELPDEAARVMLLRGDGEPDPRKRLIHYTQAVDTAPDVVALSFFSGFARRAYDLADRYRALGVRVVAGGPHVSYWTEEALQHVDVVVTGEAESVWPEVLRDLMISPARGQQVEHLPLPSG